MCDFQRIEQAIKDYQSGKDLEESFRLINEYYRPRLIKFLARRGFPSEDLTQDVFLRVYRSIAEYRGGGSIESFSRWLFQIALNIIRDEMKKGKTQKRKGQDIPLDSRGNDDENREPPLDLPDSSSTPLEEDLLTQERKQKVKETIESLPGQMRKCMELHLYQERSSREISVLMGISVDTVKSSLRQGKAKLIAKLKADGVID